MGQGQPAWPGRLGPSASSTVQLWLKAVWPHAFQLVSATEGWGHHSTGRSGSCFDLKVLQEGQQLDRPCQAHVIRPRQAPWSEAVQEGQHPGRPS